MEKKYQVFVSSTYKDLVDERQEVMQALLELDSIPVGMELFPAADDDQWTLIKRLIDDCDYYILIVGGRYGSINKEGISYTQMEYEYAVEKEIPVISFLHKNPANIPSGKSEESKELREKLERFKTRVQQKTCKYWETPAELGSVVSRSLVKLIKDKPRTGWVKAIYVPSEDSSKEILKLKTEIESLQEEIKKSKSFAPEGTESLSQGTDKITIHFSYNGYLISERFAYDEGFGHFDSTWDDLFAEISPLMIDEALQSSIISKLNSFIKLKVHKILEETLKTQNKRPDNYKIYDEDFQTMIIQLRALGLITESIRKRSIHDKKRYWSLTPYGDTVMTRLRAIKR